MNIVVLAGGNSTERDVSLKSGSMVYRALLKKGHRVILLDSFYGYGGSSYYSADELFERDIDWVTKLLH